MQTTPTAAAPGTLEGHQPSAPPDPKALFSRLAATMARHRRAVIVVWLLVSFAAAPLALTLTGALSGAGWEAQGSTAQKVRDELRHDFPALGAENPVVVYSPARADRHGSRRACRRSSSELAGAPRARVGRRPARAADGRGPDRPRRPDGDHPGRPRRRRRQDPPGRGRRARRLRRRAEARSRYARRRSPANGPCGATSTTINEEALHKAELVSGLPTLILLFLAFGSLIAAGIPLLLALAGIAVGFAALHLLSLDHADVGVVDELLDDDRPRGRHRLQPLHRQPLPRGADRGQGRDRRDREHDVDRRQGRVPLGAHRRARRSPRCSSCRSWCSDRWRSA